MFQTENALNEHIASHELNIIKCESECDYTLHTEFASAECTANLNAAGAKEQFYDPMEIDQSQYSDDVQPLEESIEIVKVEAVDTNYG